MKPKFPTQNSLNRQTINFSAFRISLFFFFVLFASTGKGADTCNTAQDSAKIRLGACPTMLHNYTDCLDTSLITIIPMDNTSQALAALKSGRIEVAFVGRPAREKEGRDQFHEFQLCEGFTLVGKTPKMIDQSDLRTMHIRTSIDTTRIRTLLPESVSITLYASTAEALHHAQTNDAVLIPWSEYADILSLVIPHDNKGKIPAFRLPSLYCSKQPEKEYQNLAAQLSRFVKNTRSSHD